MTTNREGRRFESCRARSKNTCKLGVFSSPFLFVAPEDHVPRRTLLGSSVMKRRGPFKLLQHVGLLVPITRGFACTYSRASNLTRESNKSLSWSVTGGDWWSRGLTVTMSLGRMSNDYLGGGPAGSSLPPGPHVGQCQCNLL